MSQAQQLSFDFAPELPYILAVSPRARRVTLRVERGRGLVVTVPKRFPRRQISAIIEHQRSWIEKALADLEARTPEHHRQWPPQELTLGAIDCQVRIVYRCARVLPAGSRWLSHDVLQVDLQAASLQQVERESLVGVMVPALKFRAHEVLDPWLSLLAERHGLHYRRMSIRGQRTLWGSYSSAGTVSLNYKLLFLPAELVDYVLCHELAHGVHMNHSSAFWSVLELMQPSARGLDRKLSAATEHVPPWLELAR